MADWRAELRELAAELGERARRAGRTVERLLDRDPYHVVGYRGYGNADRALVLGRVLQNEGLADPDPSHSSLRNLIATLKRIESDPLPFARVRARVAEAAHDLVADDEGFIRHWVPARVPAPSGWQQVELELADHAGPVLPRTMADVLTPPAGAGFGVVSDLDDTVLQSHITSFIRAARLVLLENARTRLPFPGVAAFYRALEAGAAGGVGNPIFYVSSSPWNLYDVIADFLAAQGIPRGPLLLRDWDLGRGLLRHGNHKSGTIREILETFPALPFILIGDSGQEDPEIYAALVREHPGRIRAIYIRNVLAHPSRSEAIRTLAAEVSAAGSALVLADDTLAAARHAAEQGWIDEASLPEIGTEKRADEGKGGKVDAPGMETPVAPTVVVDPGAGGGGGGAGA